MTEDVKEFFHRKRVEALRKGRVRKSDYVFLNSIDNKLRPDRITREIIRLGKYTGFSGFKLHNIRHTFCTDLVMAGENLEKVRQLAGHSSLKTTEKYLHIKPEKLKGSLDKLNEFRTKMGTNGH